MGSGFNELICCFSQLMSQIDELFITTFYLCARLGRGDTGREVLKDLWDQGDTQMREVTAVFSELLTKWQTRRSENFPLQNI